MPNVDEAVVRDFGDEWASFDQSEVDEAELFGFFQEYFQLFPWDALPQNAKGFDLGCGSGRWAKFVAPRVGELHLIDPSSRALHVAQENVQSKNCVFHLSSVDHIPGDNYDFGYSLGVLHHIPDTLDGIRKCVDKLKPGAPFLIYLYYNFDNRPFWFKLLWHISNLGRVVISKLPFTAKKLVTDAITLLVYWPLARLSKFLPFLPLSQYKNSSFYTMRTDSLDRFGTKLEKRFSHSEIFLMMQAAGLERIQFSSPYWTAIGYKRQPYVHIPMEEQIKIAERVHLNR